MYVEVNMLTQNKVGVNSQLQLQFAQVSFAEDFQLLKDECRQEALVAGTAVRQKSGCQLCEHTLSSCAFGAKHSGGLGFGNLTHGASMFHFPVSAISSTVILYMRIVPDVSWLQVSIPRPKAHNPEI